MVKNPPANAGNIRDAGLIPGSGRFPGEGHGNPIQHSCLENPTDRGAWQATVQGLQKSQTQLKRLSTHAHTCPELGGNNRRGRIFVSMKLITNGRERLNKQSDPKTVNNDNRSKH